MVNDTVVYLDGGFKFYKCRKSFIGLPWQEKWRSRKKVPPNQIN